MNTRQTSGRRRFLKESLLGVAILTVGSVLPSSQALAAGTGTPLRFFSRHEYRLLQAVAARITGLPPREEPEGLDSALRADRFLAEADIEIQHQFHLLLAVFNSPLFTFLFDFRFSGFLNMEPHAQDSYIQGWMTSSLEFRRTGYQGIKRLCMSMCYTDSRSWDDIGYEGTFLPEEAR